MESFIPPVLQEAVVYVLENNDSGEHGTYSGEKDCENDLHNALNGMANGTIVTGGGEKKVED
jgi:hypothetical protein